MGQRQITIDGGDSIVALNNYAERTGVIDGEIELVVVTHGDTDRWNGLSCLLDFDGVTGPPPTVAAHWDPRR
jgi:hypothetical protein